MTVRVPEDHVIETFFVQGFLVSHWKGLRGKCSIPRRSGQMNVPEVHFTEIYEIYEKV